MRTVRFLGILTVVSLVTLIAVLRHREKTASIRGEVG
jgi:hypothetical protein